MQRDFDHSVPPNSEPDAIQGAGSKRRHHASLEYYLERFEAERSLEAQSKRDAAPSERAPPRVV